MYNIRQYWTRKAWVNLVHSLPLHAAAANHTGTHQQTVQHKCCETSIVFNIAIGQSVDKMKFNK